MSAWIDRSVGAGGRKVPPRLGCRCVIIWRCQVRYKQKRASAQIYWQERSGQARDFTHRCSICGGYKKKNDTTTDKHKPCEIAIARSVAMRAEGTKSHGVIDLMLVEVSGCSKVKVKLKAFGGLSVAKTRPIMNA